MIPRPLESMNRSWLRSSTSTCDARFGQQARRRGSGTGVVELTFERDSHGPLSVECLEERMLMRRAPPYSKVCAFTAQAKILRTPNSAESDKMRPTVPRPPRTAEAVRRRLAPRHAVWSAASWAAARPPWWRRLPALGLDDHGYQPGIYDPDRSTEAVELPRSRTSTCTGSVAEGEDQRCSTTDNPTGSRCSSMAGDRRARGRAVARVALEHRGGDRRVVTIE